MRPIQSMAVRLSNQGLLGPTTHESMADDPWIKSAEIYHWLMSQLRDPIETYDLADPVERPPRGRR